MSKIDSKTNDIAGGKVNDKTNDKTPDGKSIDKIVDSVFNDVKECAFKIDKEPVCSPKHIIKSMKFFAEKKGVKVSDNPVHIVKSMKDLLNCNSESCILKRKDFVEFSKHSSLEHILNEFFKPEGPSQDFGLLSNFNIDDVLDQFEEKFESRRFLHIPFQMRDFEKVGTQLATIDLAEEFKNGKKTFGVVLNTDWSSGGGIHWFCLFGEDTGDKIQLEYFNSSGRPPLPEVQAWLQKTKHHLAKTLKRKVDIHYSTGISFQNDDHSCGVYCLCYIWLRLEKVPATWFKKDRFNDKHMHKARKNLFRHEV